MGRRQSRPEFRSQSDPGRARTCVGEAGHSSGWVDRGPGLTAGATQAGGAGVVRAGEDADAVWRSGHRRDLNLGHRANVGGRGRRRRGGARVIANASG